MRIRMLVVTGAALVAMGGTAAAAHAAGQGSKTAAPTGTVVVSTVPDDRGQHVEPGDDRGRASTSATSASPAATTAAVVDDRGRHAEPGDDHGRGRGGDDGPGHH